MGAEADEGWLIVTEEVQRLCFSIVQNFGVELAQTLLQLFKQLDKRQIVTLEEFSARELRKKVRHLLQAFCLTVVDAKKVPGAKDVPIAFKKPSDCHLSLAANLKPFLIEAVRRVAVSEEDEAEPAKADAAETEDLESRRAFLEQAIQQARDEMESSLLGKVSGPAKERAAEEEVGPMPAAAEVPQHKGGMLSLDEYRQMREAGADMQPHFTRHRVEEADDAEQLSLMELRQMGRLQTSPDELRKYEEAREKHTALWGASKSKQQRILQKAEQKAERLLDRKRPREEDSGGEEPWNRFDRDKLFESLSATRSTKKGFDEFMEMAAERKAAFAKEGSSSGKRQQY